MQTNVLMIAEYLKESGAPTGMLASDLQDELKKQNAGKVWVLRAPGNYKPGGLAFMRLRNLLLLHVFTPFLILAAQIFSLFSGRKLVVVATTSPPLIHWTAQFFAFLFRARTLTWYQDAHPEIECRLLEKRNKNFLAGLLRAVDSVLMRITNSVVTLDSGMSNDLKKRCPNVRNVEAIPPWATFVEPSVAFRAPKNSAQVKILYAGNYGKAHDLSPFVELLRSQPVDIQSQLQFTFVGMNAASAATLKELFSGLHVSQVFLPRFQKLTDLFVLMKEMDFGLVSLNHEFAGVMCPSKAYTYLSQGTAILNAGPPNSLSDELCQTGWGYNAEDFFEILRSRSLDFALHDKNGHFFQNPRHKSIPRFLEKIETL